MRKEEPFSSSGHQIHHKGWERVKLHKKFALLSGGALFLLFSLTSPARLHAEGRQFDPESSIITVRVFKSGLFSFLAHDHVIRANGLQGLAEIGESPSVAFQLRAGQLKVIDPEISAKERAEVQQTMEGEKVLNVNQYPEIRFQSVSVIKQASDRWEVHGNLTFHGRSRTVLFTVHEDGGRYRGKTTLRQKDFEIEPIRIAAGAVSVKDEVEIEFDVGLASKP